MERVAIGYENSPIIIVAPHGHKSDDYNTDLITQYIAKYIKASYLINQGWERGDDAKEDLSIADCNNVNHLTGVVEDEFLKPLKRLVARSLQFYNECLIVYIHGVSNSIRQKTGYKNLDMIFGYGDGDPPSLTCSIGFRNKFLYEISNDRLECFVGKAGGKYSGWSKHNLNQYWRKQYKDYRVESFQLEITRDLRDDKVISELTANAIAQALRNAHNFKKFTLPVNFLINYI